MADIALDPEGLRRDRERYAVLLDQAEQQIATWNQRADHLQQAIDGFDHLLALSGADPAADGGVPHSRRSGRSGLAAAAASAPPVAGATAAGAPRPPARKAAARSARPAPSEKAAARPAATKPPPPPLPPPAAPEPVARPAAPAPPVEPPAPAAAQPIEAPAPVQPVEPPPVGAAEAPRGTDALRTVFESAPERTWSLADLIGALGSRGWLPSSKRPEEGVRISLKRLAERGGVVRTDDGRWQLATAAGAGQRDGHWPPAEVPPAPSAPVADAAPAAQPPPAEPPSPPPAPPAPPPAPAGRPVGGTVTEV